MTDQQFIIDLETDQRAFVEPDDAGWLGDRLNQQPGSTRLRMRYDDTDTEGHAFGNTRVRVIVEDDTEGHALDLHFPSQAEAEAFRKRLLLTGVLAGTIALGAAGGIGLANMTTGDAASGGAAQAEITGSDWTQAERQVVPAAPVQGSAWTADERPGAASGSGSETSGGEAAPLGGPTPR